MRKISDILAAIFAFYGFTPLALPQDEEKRLLEQVESAIKNAEYTAENGATIQEKRDAIRKARQTLTATRKRIYGR